MESHPEGLNSEADDTIKQVTTISNSQTISITEVIPETPEDTDELIDKIFKDVPLQPVGTFNNYSGSVDSLSKNEGFSDDVHVGTFHSFVHLFQFQFKTALLFLCLNFILKHYSIYHLHFHA